MVIFVLFFEKILRRFFIGLDSVLFNFISTLYDLLMEISRTTILSQGEIARLAQRIELLLGIFMLFKLSFSLITYIVNPDDFSDKQKGFGKLIQSAVISLLMLVLVPYIFQMAFNLQTKILEGNILAKLIMGEDTGDDSYLNSAGDDMAFDVMLPFFLPNTGLKSSDLSACITIYDSNGDFSKDCEDALTKTGINNVTLHNYITGISERSLGLTFRTAMVIETPKDIDDEFIIDYKLLISTVVAVVVCLLLVTFCIDIGVRSVKLAFLQLIYPIPVISYMDPKSGKDGLFKKWYKMCFSTFLSLFVRLLALYFGIYIIYRVGQFGMYDVITGAQKTGFWLQVFIIIGVLMFVKQLPKILENMGIKLDGDGKFTLNPLKKIEEGDIGGKALKKAGIGVAAGGLAGAAAFGTNLIARKGNVFSAAAGAVSGARRGLKSGLKGEKFGKAYTNSYGGAMKARTSRADRKADGVGWGEMVTEKAKQTMGIHTLSEKNQSLAKEQEIRKKNADIIKGAKSTLTSLVEKNPDMDLVRSEKSNWDNMSAETYMKDHNSRNPHNTIDLQTAVQELAVKQKQADDRYKARLQSVLQAHIHDADVENTINEINQAINAMGDGYSSLDSNNFTELWDQIGFNGSNSVQARKDSSDAAAKIANYTTGKEAQHASKVSEYAKKNNQK